MKKNILRIGLFCLLLLIVQSCQQERTDKSMPPRLRAQIDRHNKESFVNRYTAPGQAIEEAYKALDLLRDSLPSYHDGILRSFNNLAFDYYMLAEHDSASAYVDSVLTLCNRQNAHQQGLAKPTRKNVDVERLIAQLMKIRLLQRSCHIAESYQLLYDIDQAALLKSNTDNYLYAYAQMEYYITSLTLNYHYRNKAVASSSSTRLNTSTKKNMNDLIDQIETERPHLRCDYAEDLALNYALAHSYYRLAAAMHNDSLLGRTYDYLSENARILTLPDRQYRYHLANVFQLQAFIIADTNIPAEAYTLHCAKQRRPLDRLAQQFYPDLKDTMPNTAPIDYEAVEAYGRAMFRISTDLFFQTSDPYQHLGAVVAAAEYSNYCGKYDEARTYYQQALNDPSWHDDMAPKFESMLYDGLIRTGYSDDPDQNTQWYTRQIALITYISQNESADATLQNRLQQSETRNHYYFLAISISALFLIVLSALVVTLRHRSKILHREKKALQEAKRQDVERIANVETCLSVLRHDINPFLSYLTNKKLSDEMRQEVLEQLLRTFANIKNWTNISIPSGMAFQRSNFLLSEVFDNVSASCVRLHPNVELLFHNTSLSITGDRQLVEILLRNLVNNALQHTQQGMVDIRADVWQEDDHFVHLSIHDTGCGMDEEELDNLFRADKKIAPNPSPSENNDGHTSTGFGLILCKYIIKRHDDNTLRGCRIWAESQVGQGSTFHCLFAKADD